MKILTISGLGADQRVFKYLKLEYKLISVDWIKPNRNETIVAYSKRLIQEHNIDKEQEFGILGVSFGGLIATEISKLTNPKFTILISSVETRSELPNTIKLFGKSGIINFIPKRLLKPPKFLAHFMFDAKNKALLNAILNDTDIHFTKWAIRELINWQNQTKLENSIKIVGSKDKLLPQKDRNNIVVENGGHFMIVDKAKKISTIINEKLEKEF